MNTVKSSALPTMPTGHAQTLRRMPPSALSSPKTLPITSRHSTVWSPMTICASNSQRTMPIWCLLVPTHPTTHPHPAFLSRYREIGVQTTSALLGTKMTPVLGPCESIIAVVSTLGDR